MRKKVVVLVLFLRRLATKEVLLSSNAVLGAKACVTFVVSQSCITFVRLFVFTEMENVMHFISV